MDISCFDSCHKPLILVVKARVTNRLVTLDKVFTVLQSVLLDAVHVLDAGYRARAMANRTGFKAGGNGSFVRVE